MNNKQNNLMSMYRTVVAVCLANVAALAKVKAFSTAFEFLRAKLTEILLTAQERELVLTGIAEDKQIQKRNLAKLGATIAAVVKGYAHTNGDMKLAAEVDFSESALFNEKDEDILISTKIIQKRATELLTKLADYGIDKTMLDLFASEIEKFSAKKPAPATAISNKELLTNKLDNLFDEANTILKEQMDTTGKIYSSIDPNFYELYKISRKIIDRGGRKTHEGVLKGTVVGKLNAQDTENGSLADVLVQNIELNIIVTSDEKGAFDFGDVAAGKYTLKLSKQGYLDLLLKDIEVKKGEDKMVDALMLVG